MTTEYCVRLKCGCAYVIRRDRNGAVIAHEKVSAADAVVDRPESLVITPSGEDRKAPDDLRPVSPVWLRRRLTDPTCHMIHKK